MKKFIFNVIFNYYLDFNSGKNHFEMFLYIDRIQIYIYVTLSNFHIIQSYSVDILIKTFCIIRVNSAIGNILF